VRGRASGWRAAYRVDGHAAERVQGRVKGASGGTRPSASMGVYSPTGGRVRADRVDGRTPIAPTGALSPSTSARRLHRRMCVPASRLPCSLLGAEHVGVLMDRRVNRSAAHPPR
jgi:hypothetical protein